MTRIGKDAPKRMKRYYNDVSVEPHADAFAIHLDGRPARTPAGAALALSNAPLADAVAAEWKTDGDHLDLHSMTLTRLAFTANDLSLQERALGTEEVVKYLRTDLLCHRADKPAALVKRQVAAWDPILDWAAGAFGERLAVTAGVRAIEQPSAVVDSARRRIETMSAWRFVGLAASVPIAGSAVIGLALVARAFSAEVLFDASRIDERFQAERWGVDAEADARERRLEAAFMAIDRWLALV